MRARSVAWGGARTEFRLRRGRCWPTFGKLGRPKFKTGQYGHGARVCSPEAEMKEAAK